MLSNKIRKIADRVSKPKYTFIFTDKNDYENFCKSKFDDYVEGYPDEKIECIGLDTRSGKSVYYVNLLDDINPHIIPELEREYKSLTVS